MSAVIITGRLLRSKSACKTSFDVVRHLLPFRLSTEPEKNIGIAISLLDAYEKKFGLDGMDRLRDDIWWMIDIVSWDMAQEMIRLENQSEADILLLVQCLSFIAEVL